MYTKNNKLETENSLLRDKLNKAKRVKEEKEQRKEIISGNSKRTNDDMELALALEKINEMEAKQQNVRNNNVYRSNSQNVSRHNQNNTNQNHHNPYNVNFHPSDVIDVDQFANEPCKMKFQFLIIFF